MTAKSKLAVILHADVVGSTELVQKDEHLAHERIHDVFERLSKTIVTHSGRAHEIRGDALVAEFDRASDAVCAAVEFQSANAAHNETLIDGIQPALRIGISMGEVVVADGTVTGAGVVLAQRLEQLAESSGIVVQGSVYETVPRRLPFDYENLGEQQLKGFEEPIRVYRVAPRSDSGERALSPGCVQQQIRYCTAHDGTRLAYATVGEGPPLIKTGNWMTHLEYDWETPIIRHLYEELTKDHQLVRYDSRGNGLSDWDVDDLSFDALVRDLETIVDQTAAESFALLGISQGSAVSVAYAAEHPERISHLILYGGYVKGWRLRSPEERVRREAMNTLALEGWGKDNPAFRQMFTSMFIPGASLEQMQWFNELERISTSGENAVRMMEMFGGINVEAFLPRVTVPTLVLHARGDAIVPFEYGRELAIGIPDAQFVPLDGKNHLLLESEPAWPRFLAEIREFLTS